MKSKRGFNVETRFYFERRASTALFNIVKNCPIGRPFLLPANICPIVPLVLCKAGHFFEFIDIHPATLCINEQEVIARWKLGPIEPNGIIYVRSYGAIIDTNIFFSRIKSLSPRALIIDDRCLCPPDFAEQIPNNTDAVLYSTGYAKYVDIGFGGFTLLRENFTYKRWQLPYNANDLSLLTDQIKTSLYKNEPLNYFDSDWLDTRPPLLPWSEYMLLVKQECKRMTILKSQVNSIYSTNLPPSIQFPKLFQGWRFNILVKNKIEVMEAIFSLGLFSSGHYQPVTALFGQQMPPHAEKVFLHVVNLFNDRYFDIDRAHKLADLLVDLKLTSSELTSSIKHP